MPNCIRQGQHEGQASVRRRRRSAKDHDLAAVAMATTMRWLGESGLGWRRRALGRGKSPVFARPRRCRSSDHHGDDRRLPRVISVLALRAPPASAPLIAPRKRRSQVVTCQGKTVSEEGKRHGGNVPSLAAARQSGGVPQQCDVAIVGAGTPGFPPPTHLAPHARAVILEREHAPALPRRGTVGGAAIGDLRQPGDPRHHRVASGRFYRRPPPGFARSTRRWRRAAPSLPAASDRARRHGQRRAAGVPHPGSRTASAALISAETMWRCSRYDAAASAGRWARSTSLTPMTWMSPPLHGELPALVHAQRGRRRAAAGCRGRWRWSAVHGRLADRSHRATPRRWKAAGNPASAWRRVDRNVVWLASAGAKAGRPRPL